MTNSRKLATYILGAVLVFALVFVATFALLPTNAPTAQAEPIVTFTKVTSEDQITAENIGECTFEDMKAWVGSHWDGIFDGVYEYANVLFVYAVESGYKGSSFCKANFASGEDFATSDRVGLGMISSIDQVKESYQLDGDVVYLCGFEVAAPIGPVPYLDAKGAEQTCEDFTVVTASTTAFEDGKWYVAKSGTVNVAGSILFEGTVNLILCDGATLKVENGGISDGGRNATLLIYGQTNGTGTLSAATSGYNAIQCQDMVINGGIVQAVGASAGISAMGNVTINGGSVSSTGTDTRGLAAGSLTINDGTVTATGGRLEGFNIHFGLGTLTVNGGTVTAIGGMDGASPSKGIKATLADTGLIITAGDDEASAVSVTELGEQKWVHIEKAPHTHNYSTDVWSYDATGHWHACQNVGCNAPKADEAAHTYGEDLSEVSYYTCSVCGYVDNERKAEVPLDPVTYLDETGAEQSCTAYTVMDADTTDLTDGWYVVSSDVTSVDRISVHGDVKLILCDGKTLTNNYYVNCWYYDTDSLTVYVQSTGENMGSLVVDTSANAPYFTAIDVTNLTINGGTILAKGNSGIEATELRINGGDVTAIALNEYSQGIRTYNANINGGKVVATGQFGINGPITISGGDVYAEGTVYGFFIAGGGGAKKAMPQGDISINGGNVTAVGGEQAIFGTLKNAIAGTGWTDVEGTEGMAAVAVSTEGQTLDYKKVTFAAHTHAYGEDITDESYYTCDCGEIDDERKAAYDAAQEIAEAESLISAIGTVEYTDECKAKIDAARTAYDALTAEQKALVDNYDVLTAAEARYAALRADADAAAEVIKLIDSIGTVEYTTESKAKIDKALAAFAGLTPEQKLLVANKAELPTAENTYDDLEDQAKAQEVEAKINAIGEVKYPGSRQPIKEARAAYDALTLQQKVYVGNYDKLTAAEAAYAELKKEKAFDIGWIAFIFGMIVLAYFAAFVVLTKVYGKDGKLLHFIGLIASAAVIFAAIIIFAVQPSVVALIGFSVCIADALCFILYGTGKRAQPADKKRK